MGTHMAIPYCWHHTIAELYGGFGGVMRHILPYLEMFRLCFWLSLIVLTDAYAEGTDRPLARPAYPPINEE